MEKTMGLNSVGVRAWNYDEENQDFILKHSIKKRMFSILGKMNLFRLGMGEA